MLFFSGRRRHTRCALVTGVQTGALPISGVERARFGNLPNRAPHYTPNPASISEAEAEVITAAAVFHAQKLVGEERLLVRERVEDVGYTAKQSKPVVDVVGRAGIHLGEGLDPGH